MINSLGRRFLVVLMLLGMTCCSLPASGTAAAVARGPVTIARVEFFNGRHFLYRSCTPLGGPQRSFHNTAVKIFDRVVFSNWQGRHTDQDRWYAPGDRFYYQDNPLTSTGHGRRTDCGLLRMAGTRAASMLGTWTYRLVLDGRVVYVAHFQMAKAP